jgi:hypothetical protein
VENVKLVVDKNIATVENFGRALSKKCLKTEMHRLVAMHLRVG